MDKVFTTTISKTYANALYDSLNGADMQLVLDEISATIHSSTDLKIVMSNSSISTSKKFEMLDLMFKGKIDEKILNLLKVLVEKHRFAEFDMVNQAYKVLLNEKAKVKNVEIISAISLSNEYKNIIVDKLSKKMSCNIVPTWSVDENIIAGLIFKYDDSVIDTSLSTKLKSLSNNIMV